MKRIFAVLAVCLLAMAQTLSGATAFPYPQNRGYSYGSKPTITGSDATTIKGYYTAWLGSHLTSSGAGGYKRIQQEDKSNDTTSEGISYGMLLSVYFDDQATFDQLWSYKQLHNDGLGLMNWWISSGGGTSGGNSAADADQDICYALYLAYYQWGTAAGGSSSGTSYKTLADAELTKIAAYDLDTNRIKPGDAYNSCRYPSYFMPNEYKVFGKQGGDTATWNAVYTNCMNTIAAARNPSTGILGEQCTDTGQGGGCQASDPPSQDKYNSSRVPLRMAMDYVYYGDSAVSSELALLNSANGFGGIAPSGVGDCYNVGSSPLSSAACSNNNMGNFFGPAGTSFMQGSNSTALNNYYSYMLGNFNSSQYFAGAIQLLSLLLLSGNMPNIADQGAMFTPTNTATPTPYNGTPTTTPTPTPMAFAYVFEDAEHGLIVNNYDFAGSTAPTPTPVISYQVISQTAQPAAYGNYGIWSNANMGTGTWCGLGFDSSYAPATTGVLNFTGAVSMRFSVLSDKAISFTPMFREGNGVAGGDDEVWKANQTLTISAAQANTWQVFTIPLTVQSGSSPLGLTLNAYAGNQTGNKVPNLSSVKTVEFDFVSAAGANVIFDNIDFIPGVLPTMTYTKTPFPNPYTVMYDDFESAGSLTSAPKRLTTYADTADGASASLALDTSTFAAGAKSAKLTYTLGTKGVSYGCGGSLVSPYGTVAWNSQSAITGTAFDASNSVSLNYWIKGDPGLVYQMIWQEAGNTTNPVGSSDGEAWYSNYLTTNGSWQQVTIDLGDMAEDPYNTTCNPTGIAAPGPCLTGAASGNNTQNLNAVWQVGIKLPGQQVGVANRSSSLWLDNINFITTYRSPTTTPTFTAGAGSPTPTITPSSSRTPTASPTTTPTASPTASPTATPTVTPTASPTASPSSSATASLSASPSGSPSATRSVSPSGTPTASPSASPSVTPSYTSVPTGSSPTVTPTNSPVFSATPTVTQTATNTSTTTPTDTASSTATPSSTAVPGTPTPSLTPSLTGSPVLSSPTDSPTNTVPTATFTSIPWTATPSATPSVTPVNTATDTATLTVTIFSPTASNTPPPSTATLTFTGTPSPSPTVTGTLTNTPDATAVPPSATTSPTVTPSATPPPGAPVLGGLSPAQVGNQGTQTLTLTGQFVAGDLVIIQGGSVNLTLTPQTLSAGQITVQVSPLALGAYTVVVLDGTTLQRSGAMGLTVKAPEGQGGPLILETDPVPNPNPIDVAVHLNYAADAVELKVYTQSMALLGSSKTGAQPAGWAKVGLPWAGHGTVPSGTYYYVIQAWRNGSVARASKIGHIVVAR